MTEDEPAHEQSAGAASSADDDLWLTYLNYDLSIQQAVRRLGALSRANVDEFRALLLKSRDRTRVKDYEAESIRRLQGEAFVGDEDLQRALIVLTAEDPRLGEELKRVVAATGKPQELDQTIAAIRLQKDAPNRPMQTPANQAPANPPPVTIQEPPPAAVPLAAAQAQPAGQPSSAKRLAIAGAIAAVALIGLIWVMPRFATENTQKTSSTQAATVALRPSAAEDAHTVPPGPAVQQAPAPPAQTAITPAKPPMSSGAAHAASSAPDKSAPEKQASASPPSDSAPAATPVPGEYYKVVRGDMLSQIALVAYRDASQFPRIQKANPGLRYGPDRILVDQVIFIPPAP